MGEQQGVAAALAAVAAETAGQSTRPDIAEAAQNAVIDWSAAAIGGSATPLIRALRAGLADGDSGPARLVGEVTCRTSPATAAFINGTAAHTLEVDDIYAPGFYHPGAPTIAAALAVADREGADGSRLIAGIAAGVEVGCRVAEDLGTAHYRLWHTTGTVGAIGAAVASAVVLGATEAQIAGAITLAATMTGGVQQTFRRDGHGKPMHSGQAAQTGVVAALAAKENLHGAWDVLEGDAGLAVATGAAGTSWATCRSPFASPTRLQQLTVKPYPCCGHTFAVADSAGRLRAEGVDLDDIEAVEVATYGVAVEAANISDPRTSTEARFSIPFIVATMLRDGRLDAASFSEERVVDERLAGVMRRVSVSVDPDLDAAAPQRRGARVALRLVDGRVFADVTPDRSGSPENPMDARGFDEKYAGLVHPVLGAQGGDALLVALRALPELASVERLGLAASFAAASPAPPQPPNTVGRQSR